MDLSLNSPSLDIRLSLQQSYFTFPDVAVCTSFLNGCLSSPPDSCLFGEDLILSSQTVSFA